MSFIIRAAILLTSIAWLMAAAKLIVVVWKWET